MTRLTPSPISGHGENQTHRSGAKRASNHQLAPILFETDGDMDRDVNVWL